MKVFGRDDRQTNAVAEFFGFTNLADGLNNSGKHGFQSFLKGGFSCPRLAAVAVNSFAARPQGRRRLSQN